MAIFDELVLEISLIEFAETLHAKFYLYELMFVPSGVSVTALSVEDTPVRSVFFGTIILMNSQDLPTSSGNALELLK